MYAGAIGYGFREVLKGKLVKNAMNMSEGAGSC